MLGNMGPRKVGYGRISTRCISNCITICNKIFSSLAFFYIHTILKQHILAGASGNTPLSSMLRLYACCNRNNFLQPEPLFRTCFTDRYFTAFYTDQKSNAGGLGCTKFFLAYGYVVW